MSDHPKQSIWREGYRLRRTDGTGYADLVSDEQIQENITGADPLHDAFAEAVLAIRKFEHLASCVHCRTVERSS